MDTVLEIVGLRKAFGSTVALDDVSLAISEGSIVGLLGPNGAGKTTLMKVVVGLVKADAGQIRLGSTSIGALIERPGFYPYLSARQNLHALGLTAGMAGSALAERVASTLARVGLQGAADRKFGQFSTGMKQRLGIGAALVVEPRLLILDEPVSGLDPAGVAEMRRLLLELRGEGRTTLVSSHLLGEVEQVCDQIAIIDRGRMLAAGPISEITSGPQTWRLIFSQTGQAERAAELLGERFATSVSGLEVLAVARDGTDVAPLEIVSAAGLLPREASLQQASLEKAYLRLIDTPAPEQRS